MNPAPTPKGAVKTTEGTANNAEQEGREEQLPEPVTPGAMLSKEGEAGSEEPGPPGTFPLDEGLERIEESMKDEEEESYGGES